MQYAISPASNSRSSRQQQYESVAWFSLTSVHEGNTDARVYDPRQIRQESAIDEVSCLLERIIDIRI